MRPFLTLLGLMLIATPASASGLLYVGVGEVFCASVLNQGGSPVDLDSDDCASATGDPSGGSESTLGGDIIIGTHGPVEECFTIGLGGVNPCNFDPCELLKEDYCDVLS